MNDRNIEIFLAICNTRSISRASQVLFLSQSNVSHSLKQLEEELNTALILRSKGKKTVDVTQRGKEFIPLAQKWMELYAETQRFKESNNSLFLSVGSVETLVANTFSSYFAGLIHKNGPLDLSVQIFNSDVICQMVEQRDLDAGLVLQYIPLKNLTFQLIMQEPMRLIRKRFPGQNQRSVHPHELDPKGEVFLNWSVEYKLWHDTWFLGSQRPHLTVSTIALMTIALQDEENWGIVPESVARDIAVSCDLDILEIQEPPPERFIYFITNAAPAPESAGGIQMFWEGLIHYIKERGLYFQQMED